MCRLGISDGWNDSAIRGTSFLLLFVKTGILFIQRIFFAKGVDARACFGAAALVCRRIQHMCNDARHFAHIFLFESARGERGRAETDAARDERATRLEWDRVAVRRDVDLVEERLCLLARDIPLHNNHKPLPLQGASQNLRGD